MEKSVLDLTTKIINQKKVMTTTSVKDVVGGYPRSKLGTRRVVNKGILHGIDGRRTGMRTQ